MTAAVALAPLVGQHGLAINKGAVDSTSAPDFDIASFPPDNASAHFLNRATGIAQDPG